MNDAYELADELDEMLNAVGMSDNRVPTMIRKQADTVREQAMELIVAWSQADEHFNRLKELELECAALRQQLRQMEYQTYGGVSQ